MSTRGVYRDTRDTVPSGTVGVVLKFPWTLPERYKRVVEGHFQLQRWYKGAMGNDLRTTGILLEAAEYLRDCQVV